MNQAWKSFQAYGTKKEAEIKVGMANGRTQGPNAAVAGVILLLLISGQLIRGAEAGPATCAGCMAGVSTVCAPLMAAGGACFSVAAFPPLLCGCLLASGSGVCLYTVILCTAVCLAPTA